MKTKPTTAPTPLWFYVHLPQLALNRLERQADTTQQALAIIDGTPGRVVQCNALARQAGIRPGMSLATAHCLHSALLSARHQPEDDARGLDELAQWLYRYSAWISVVPPDGILLEVASMLRLFNGLNALWQGIASDLHALAYEHRAACGPTPLCARFLARAAQGHCSEDRQQLLARACALDLCWSDLPPRTIDRCQRMGLKRINELLALPPKELARRLEPETLDQLKQLTGQLPDPRPAYVPPPSFQRKLSFLREVEHLNGLLFPLQRVLKELCLLLDAWQLATDRLELRLHYRDREDSLISLRAAQAEYRHSEWLTLTRLQLERLTQEKHALTHAATGLSLDAKVLLPRELTHTTTLLPEDVPHPQQTLELVGRLRARLGDDAVLSPLMVNDHRPEYAGRLAAHPAPLPRSAALAAATPLQLRRPLWLLPTPERLPMPPKAVLQGPERLVSGWWDGPMLSRDYYIASFTSGETGWVFRQPDGAWYLHGWFA